MAYKISINKKKCIGCGTCVATSPKSFRIKNEKAEAIKEKIKRLEDGLAAESACPVQAIKISKL